MNKNPLLCNKCNRVWSSPKDFSWNRNQRGHCRECVRAYEREHRADRREPMQDYKRKYNYGISPEDYNRKFQEQNGVCEICHRPNVNNRALGVDHNHETNQVRGLLCNHCNLIIGHAKEDIGLLIDVIQYLNKYEIFNFKELLKRAG